MLSLYNVVIIYAGHNTLPSHARIREGLLARIAESKPENESVELYEEFMDDLRLKIPKEFDLHFLDLWRTKYTNVKIDMIVTIGASADQLLHRHPEFFWGIPYYTVGLSTRDKRREDNQKVINNIFKIVDIVSTTLPDTKRLAVIVAEKGNVYHQNIAENIALIESKLSPKMKIEFWTLSFDELFERAKQLPENTALLYFPYGVDRLGNRKIPFDVLKKLTQVSSAPIFVNDDTYLKLNVVGGYVRNLREEGDVIGRLILGMEVPQTEEAWNAKVRGYFFNDAELKRWHIFDENLPPNSTILNRPDSFFYTYRWHIVMLMAIFAEATLIVMLIRSLRRGKKTRAELADERNLLEVRVAERTHELEESRTLFEDAAQIAKLGVFDWNLVTNELHWDDSMFVIYGVDAQNHKLVYEFWRQMALPGEAEKVEDAVQTAIATNMPLNTQFRIERPDGKICTIHILAQIYRDVDKKPLRLVGVNQDITEREELEAHLAKSKSEFIANMSHDIRTPINGIIGLSKIVLKKEMPTEIRYYLDKIYHSSNVLLDLLNNVLDFSKLEADGYQLDSSNFNLRQTLENISHIFIDGTKDQPVNFVINIAPDVPDELLGDTTKLQQILINLLSNAKKFTKQGEIVTTIELKDIVNNTAALHFTVRDTGIGMSAEQLEKLFQPFSQADSSITRKYGGTGLGLFISKKFVELMGGEIHVESVYGQGTAFTFEIPFTINAKNKSQTIANTSAQHFNSQRILLVDDNEINQIVAEELLTSLGLNITIANNGEEAVALVLTEKFDLVLMDVQMPIMDGLTATRLIRTYPSFEKLPIIAMTANGMQGDSEKSLAAGMNGHLTKPIEVEKVAAELARWLKVEDALPNIATTITITKINCLPESLPPFDLTRALLLINNNQTLLYKLLLSFHKRYFDAANQLTNLINAKDFLQAEHLAHSINGVAGTLAAHRLKNAAATFEKTLNYGQYEEIDELLNALTIELKIAIDATASLLPLPNQIEKENLSETELNQLFEQLKLALSRNDFRAVDIFSKLKPHLEVGDLQYVVVELSNWIDKLDFRQASLILNKASWNKEASQ